MIYRIRSRRIPSCSRDLCCRMAIISLHTPTSLKLDMWVRNFIDCGGLTGKEEKVVLQTHVGSDIDHRLRSDRFAKILRLGNRVIPGADLDVDVEYDCCVVAQYPIAEITPDAEHLNLILERGRTLFQARYGKAFQTRKEML